MVAALCSMAGCHSQRTGTPDEEELLAERTTVSSALESDHAGVVFAQKVVALDQENEARDRAKGEGSDAAMRQRAQADLYAAQLMLKLSEDRMRVIEDMSEWKRIAATPIMMEAGRDPR